MSSTHISVVAPVYGCKTCLAELYLRLKKSLEVISTHFEIILVNDASPDNAWETIEEIAKKDPRVKGIDLSRNFGQHYAITAGIELAKGEWVIVMDCDLQDQPEEITKLYSKAQEGFDVVLARRHSRQDTFFKVFASKMFYSTLGYLTDTEQDSTIANFGIYHNKVITAICNMGDSMRYFPTMVRWVGFKQTAIDIEHASRTEGKSSYNFKRLMKLGLDVVLSFSQKPLVLTIKLGALISLFAFGAAGVFLVKYLMGDIIVMGWITLALSIWLFSGIIIMIIGIVGLYIGKTFENVKQRPRFIIKTALNFENKNE